MITYRMQLRVIEFPENESLSFPDTSEIEMTLGPPQVFGISNELVRTLPCNGQGQTIVNRHTGRALLQPLNLLDPMNLTHSFGNPALSKWEFVGEKLKYTFKCRDMQHLKETIEDLYYLLVPLLNIAFWDVPYVTSIRGRVGKTQYVWVHYECRVLVEIFEADGLTKKAKIALDRMTLFDLRSNRRLAAALHYFHVARRLLTAGQSQWEFMPEYVLNLDKTLTILFAKSDKNSRDQVKSGLTTLGYSLDEINGDFLPIMILRSQFDVAHPRLTVFSHDDLTIIYKFLERSEKCMRNMLNRLLTSIEQGSYKLPTSNDDQPNFKTPKEMILLIESIKSRLDIEAS